MASVSSVTATGARESAITWRSVSALVFAAAVVQPLILYLTLVGSEGLITLSLMAHGGGLGLGYSLVVFTSLGGQVLWLVVIFWTWLARSFGRDLTAKETFVIFAFYPTTVGTATLFILPIYRLYIANSYIIEELGLAQYIPSFWAPHGAEGLVAYSARSLFSAPMVIPTSLGLVVFGLTLVCDLSLGIFAYYRYGVVEKLDFPAASASARGILVISGADPGGKQVLMASAALGILYSFFSWFLPGLTGIQVLQLFPRGITDFTYLIEGRWPGASFGIDFSWITLATGFVVPLKILVVMAVTSVAAYSAGNALLVSYGIWPDWAPKYGLGWNFARSSLYWWTSVTIGLSIAAAFVPMALRPRQVARIFASIGRGLSGPEGGAGGLLPKLLLALFFVSSGLAVALFYVLVPDFPVWLVLLFVMGWSFFATMVAANAAGVTFGGFYVPFLRESLVYYSGYQDPKAWFARDFMMFSQGGAGHASQLRMGQICGVNIAEYVKGFIFAAAVGLFFGFLYATVFWQTAPIPSYIYKFTLTGWPVMALESARWTKWLWTGVLFKTEVILGAAAVGAAIAVATDLLLGAPWFLISMVTGLNTVPSSTILPVVGGIIGGYLRKRMGPEAWRRAAPLILVGMGLGDGLMIALGSALSIVAQSMWSLPY
ncbi:MAG: hypothetical protein QW057_02215 [Candidatus Bathyarchaeia archaeon]